MTKDELWQWTVDYAVPKGEYQEKMIQRLLKIANGNVSQALAMMTKVHWREDWTGYCDLRYDSISARLGGHSYTGPNIPRVDVMGAAASHPVHAWFPESKWDHKKPDLIIPWREVFEYIARDRQRVIQKELF